MAQRKMKRDKKWTKIVTLKISPEEILPTLRYIFAAIDEKSPVKKEEKIQVEKFAKQLFRKCLTRYERLFLLFQWNNENLRRIAFVDTVLKETYLDYKNRGINPFEKKEGSRQ